MKIGFIGLGAMGRHGVNLLAARLFGITFPWGTFAVNVLGSLAMGLIAGWLTMRAELVWSQHVRLFLMTGILGGFTTFSAFGLETFALLDDGQFLRAAWNILVSVLLGLIAVWIGFRAAQRWLGV